LPVEQGRGRRPTAPWPSVSPWRHPLAPDRWTRGTGRDGAQGPVEIAMVTHRVQSRRERPRTGPEEWRGVPRPPRAAEGTVEEPAAPAARDQAARDDSRYYRTPTRVAKGGLEEPALRERARGITAGMGLESRFQRGKGKAGMDAYQVRTWEGWHQHRALTWIAVWVLLSAPHRGQQWPPALPLPPVRSGLRVLRLETFLTLGVSSICHPVQRQGQRNEVARFSHYRPRKCLPPRK
jgi:hypothetical protein